MYMIIRPMSLIYVKSDQSRGWDLSRESLGKGNMVAATVGNHVAGTVRYGDTEDIYGGSV